VLAIVSEAISPEIASLYSLLFLGNSLWIYDTRKNKALVMIGTSRETPEFATDAIEKWRRL
jgi:hypothetical protein